MEYTGSSKVLATQICAALLYAVTSTALTLVNKALLTTYKFPSVLLISFGQMIAIILAVALAVMFAVIQIPFSFNTFKLIWPLPLFYFGNMVFGLMSTWKLSLPMFTALRKFSILFTMILEGTMLAKRSHGMTRIAVFLMILGSMIAALNDFTFTITGYCAILATDLLTALNGVYTKKCVETKELGLYGLMFYNALATVFPTVLLILYLEDIEMVITYTRSSGLYPSLLFLSSCLLGIALAYSTSLCTKCNSALTTSVVGCCKNVFITYYGLTFGGDYHYTFANFLGLNISVLASLLYIYAKYLQRKKPIKAPSDCLIS